MLLRGALIAVLVGACDYAQSPPKVWDDAQLADWANVIAGLNVRPGFFSAREYYAVAGDNLRTYPVYHPDREPPGYWQRLHQLKPEPLVDSSWIRTQQEWIAGGKRAWEELDATSFRTSDPALIAKAR